MKTQYSAAFFGQPIILVVGDHFMAKLSYSERSPTVNHTERMPKLEVIE